MAFFDYATWVVSLARTWQNCILESPHEYLSVARIDFGLPVQQTVTVLALLELALRYVSTVTVQLDLVVIKFHLTLAYNKLIWVRILPPTATHVAKLLIICTKLNLNKFLYATNSKIIFKLKVTLSKYFPEIKFALLQSLEEEIIFIIFALKEVNDRPIEYFLNLLEFVDWLGIE